MRRKTSEEAQSNVAGSAGCEVRVQDECVSEEKHASLANVCKET